jgi:hypothetical protein
MVLGWCNGVGDNREEAVPVYRWRGEYTLPSPAYFLLPFFGQTVVAEASLAAALQVSLAFHARNVYSHRPRTKTKRRQRFNQAANPDLPPWGSTYHPNREKMYVNGLTLYGIAV